MLETSRKLCNFYVPFVSFTSNVHKVHILYICVLIYVYVHWIMCIYVLLMETIVSYRHIWNFSRRMTLFSPDLNQPFSALYYALQCVSMTSPSRISMSLGT